jgi:hypothetical protein
MMRIWPLTPVEAANTVKARMNRLQALFIFHFQLLNLFSLLPLWPLLIFALPKQFAFGELLLKSG